MLFIFKNLLTNTEIYCDKGQINRALLNVYKNAIESIASWYVFMCKINSNNLDFNYYEPSWEWIKKFLHHTIIYAPDNEYCKFVQYSWSPCSCVEKLHLQRIYYKYKKPGSFSYFEYSMKIEQDFLDIQYSVN